MRVSDMIWSFNSITSEVLSLVCLSLTVEGWKFIFVELNLCSFGLAQAISVQFQPFNFKFKLRRHAPWVGIAMFIPKDFVRCCFVGSLRRYNTLGRMCTVQCALHILARIPRRRSKLPASATQSCESWEQFKILGYELNAYDPTVILITLHTFTALVLTLLSTKLNVALHCPYIYYNRAII